jgi:hypothetical protein
VMKNEPYISTQSNIHAKGGWRTRVEKARSGRVSGITVTIHIRPIRPLLHPLLPPPHGLPLMVSWMIFFLSLGNNCF